jgi:elongation factor Ts
VSALNVIASYVHNGAIGVLIEFFVPDAKAGKSAEFSRLAEDIAKHVAAMQPASVEELLRHPLVTDDAGRSVSGALKDVAAEGARIVRFVRWSVSPDGSDGTPDNPPPVTMRAVA